METCPQCVGLGKVIPLSSKFEYWKPGELTCSLCQGLGVIGVSFRSRKGDTMANSADEKREWQKGQDVPIAEPVYKVDGKVEPSKEMIIHPQHYNMGNIEVIDAIEDWRLGFNDGNAVKYIARNRHKGQPVEDLKKALWYLARELRAVHKVTNVELISIIATVIKGEHESNSNSKTI